MRGFPFLLKFSYRNLWRAPKRTLIMLLSLSICTGYIIWDLNFAKSGSKEVMKEFLGLYAGIYQITNSEYYSGNDFRKFNTYKTITDDDIADKELLKLTTKRVTSPVFLSGEKKTLGVLLTGLDVEKELRITTLPSAVKVGKFLAPNGDKEIILGRRLAERIDAKIGDEVVAIGQAADGSVANDLFVVVGLLDFGGGDLEEALAFTQLRSAQDFMALPYERYHQRVSFDLISEETPVLKGVQVTSWTSLLPEISVSIRFIDNFTWLVSIIIVVVISLGMSNTLMITFFEREEEFQSLNIIGAKTSWVSVSLMLEVFMMGTVAILIGIFLGHLYTTYCFYNPINLEVFTGGKPIIMGGMSIRPLVRIYPVAEYYWKVPLMIYFFLGLTMIYPLVRVIRRSSHAI